ncbi:hypothetical protein K227x_37700 [Rubripirellula lacrimiformis]|uniref:DUF4259 domain-containing protein n=1 Tax=Rubripirellula lacrimiformis TaxID=1930273 RepID=A0A517NE20_9BACT|nr:DUF4259 domain-containing protein [Rubripirellula lacrimiformis]QDT05370.1 hypothetical protein K227x_37700 [Rubripirellula lacrimiformis]
MGSWGPRSFEDDIACDWLEDLLDSDPIAFFDHCLDLSGLDSLEMLACIGVVCTAEMIRGLLCGPRDGLPESAHRWLQQNDSLDVLVQSLVPSTVDGLRRVLSPDSEMYQQWDDAGPEFDAWHNNVESLLHELRLTVI